ncbi:MAG: peptide/nickel transport system permease protein [Solirubrobacterales bacterium]|jgi:peptide/nickel transport system permease protein|nr:peptide/nickel transport system permease protein [Solirubrobacterales bacterium]
MLRYIVRRVLWALLLLVLVSGVVFAIFYLLPTADPAKLRAGRGASAEQVEQIRTNLGLDDPTSEQFGRYVGGVFTPYENEDKGVNGPFDLGTSIFQNGKPVSEIIFDRLPATIMLVIGSVILWLAIAIPIGVISAVRRRSLMDRTTMVTSLAFISAPVFWLGLVALYLFASDVGVVHIFPGIGSYNDADSFSAKVGSMLLPWMVLAAATAAIYARYVRSQMIEAMQEDYVRTARAKGLSERRVILKHALRSALTPIVTLLGLDVGILLAGNAILTESVFNIPGIGKETVTAIGQSDLPLIQGIVLFGAFFIVIFNLVVDILYAYLDPRVRY